MVHGTADGEFAIYMEHGRQLLASWHQVLNPKNNACPKGGKLVDNKFKTGTVDGENHVKAI